MSEHIDHEAEAERLLDLAEQTRRGMTVEEIQVSVQAAQAHAVLALVEQQRIASRLEYTRIAVEQYGNYAPTGANLPSLFLPPETEQGNMRVPEDIARALRIGDSDE